MAGGGWSRATDWDIPHPGATVRVALPAVLETSEHRYEIERELGSGGMATVHLARDVPTGTRVAVKLLRADLVAALGLERFAREIRITSRLDHPNLLPVLDSGQVDGVPFYVTPYIEGESLSQRLKREGQLPIADTIGIACQIADALEVAHAHGFIHRDIKPGNILLAGDRAILADFGLARAVDVITGERLTESGIVLGTPAYMSPEQANNGRIDARTDIYSLGCVIYEMLAGAPPFSGPTSQSLLARHAVDPVPSLRTVRRTISETLERVVTTALAKVPADRYAGARELREALQGQERTGSVSTSRSRRAVSALGLVAVGALLLLPLTWLYSRRGGPPAVDRNRIMVFPLIAPRGGKEPSRIGEDLATMIGSALDGAGPLRWIDAWPMLDPTLRDDIRTMTLDRARGLARSERCGYSLSGRVVLRGDSADVFLELNDIQGDSTVARGRATGSATDAWQVGLRAVNDVLPRLIPGTPPNLLAEWKARDPTAIASFLLGEAAFRRAHLADALGHYREAVRADSSFGLAAIRGAQAATWNHRSSEAAAFIRVASAQPLPPRYARFARGYAAYLGGWADSAAREFHRALEIDPEMAVAWAQLGEVYTHLLPLRGNLDSLADAAFGRARQLDSTATNWLLHPIEIRLRRGDTAAATPLIHAFLTAEPDTVLAQQVRVMDACVRRGPAAVDWARMAATRPLALLVAGNELKGRGAGASCALRAFDAVIANGAKREGFEPRRWVALLGMENILLAQGRTGDAAALIDSAIARGQGGTSLYLLAAPLEPKFAARARDIARRDELEFGRNYARCPYPMRLYELGVWEAHTGRPEITWAIADDLDRRAGKSGSRADSLLARAMRADAILARGDTAEAAARLTAALSEGMEGDELLWNEALPRGTERLALARILLARREYRRAIEVADVFDAAWPSIYLLYLPASLQLRGQAAAALGDMGLASLYRNRLAQLGRSRVVALK